MRVAVTGATGLIGKAVSEDLENSGFDVVGIGRRERPGSVVWDPTSGSIDLDELGPLDAIVHLAGESIGGLWTKSKRRAILDSRIEGTKLVHHIATSLGVGVVVSGSAIGFYGDRGDEILTEEASEGTGFLADVVVRWEQAARQISSTGARVVLGRTGIVLDDENGTLPPLVKLFKLGGGARLGTGDQWWSWISLADEVRAIRLLLESDLEGPVNLTAPNPVTNAMMTKSLAQALGRPALLRVPSFALKAVLGDLAEELLLGGQRVLPTVLLEQGFEFRHPTLDEALAAIL